MVGGNVGGVGVGGMGMPYPGGMSTLPPQRHTMDLEVSASWEIDSSSAIIVKSHFKINPLLSILGRALSFLQMGTRYQKNKKVSASGLLRQLEVMNC